MSRPRWCPSVPRAASLCPAVAAAGALALLAGCGSESSETSSASTPAGAPAAAPASGVDAVKTEVAALLKPTNRFVAPGPAVDASSLKGKTVWFIPLAATIPTFGVEGKGIDDAAKALGITIKVCDGNFTPAAASACISQAARAGADGMIVDAIAPAGVGPALKLAKSKKLPTVLVYGVEGEKGPLQQYVSVDDKLAHTLAAKWIIADSGGKADILASVVEGDPSAEQAARDGGLAELDSKCPDCKVDTFTSTPTTVDGIPATTSTALLKNPQVQYGFPEFNFLFPGFQRGAQQAGKASKLKLVSSSQDLASMKRVKSGVQAADAGTNRNYAGWTAMDAYVRMALGKPAQTKQFVPGRIFDKTNIDSVPVTEAGSKSGEWFGPTDAYTQGFETLWGLG